MGSAREWKGIDVSNLAYPNERGIAFLGKMMRKNGSPLKVPMWFRNHLAWWELLREANRRDDVARFFDDELGRWAEWSRLVESMAKVDPNKDYSEKLRTWGDDKEEGLNMRWMWDRWIANGIYTLLVGYGKIGKSYVLLELIGRMMRGEEMPDGAMPSSEMKGKKCLWIDSERSQGFNPKRAETLGIPLNMMVYPFEELRVPRFDVPADREAIENAAENDSVGIVAVDSFSRSHGLRENDSEVGTISAWLSDVALHTGKPVMALHHLRKPGRDSMKTGEITVDDVRGHGSITQTARTIIGVDIPNVDDKKHRRIHLLEGNFSTDVEPLGFTIDNDGVHFCDAPEVKKAVSLLDTARSFLKSLLADGPVPVKAIEEEAECVGLSWATVKRAKQSLKIPDAKLNGRSHWALPCSKYGEGDE